MIPTTFRRRVLVFTTILSFIVYMLSSLSIFRFSRRPNGVIFMLVSPSRITQATMALLNVEDRFNRRLKYPYVLFIPENEASNITDEVKAKVSWITEGRATFANISNEWWGTPEFLDGSRIQNSLKTIGFSTGYRSMCRFYSGLVWRHPAVAHYDWLWRLDTDIQFHCNVPYDPIERMIENKALYGFVQVLGDTSFVQPSLASNVSKFLSENQHLIPPEANHGFVWKGKLGIEKALRGVAGTAEWNGNCMYNNFEISHRSVWESEIYLKFFTFLDQAGGFFYERWGDAPVHSYGLAMSLKKQQVMQFNDMGYQHQGWAYGCPNLNHCACLDEGVAKDFNDRADTWFNPLI